MIATDKKSRKKTEPSKRQEELRSCIEALWESARSLDGESIGLFCLNLKQGSVFWIPKRMMREVEEELAEDITKGRRIVLENLTGGFKKAAKEFWERNGVDLYDVETDWGRIAFVPAE